MTAKNDAAVQRIVEQVKAELLRRSVAGVTKACDDLAIRAQGYAPVSRGRAGRSEKGHRISLRSEAQFRNQGALETLSRLEEVQARGRVRTLARVSRNQSFLRSFQFAGPFQKKGERLRGKTPRALRGKSPAAVAERRGRLVGFTSKETSHTGGSLRASIHVMGIDVTEGRVSGHVGSKLSYAGPVEYGYHQFSHGKATGVVVAGRPFLRKAGKEVGERIADYFRE